MRIKLISLLILALFVSSVFAGETKRGEAGFMFLKVPLGARETALGMSGLTSTNGASAIYWNPANVSAADRPTFAFSYLNHFAGISSNYAGVSFPLSDVGVFGVSFNYMSYGDIVKTTEDAPDGSLGHYAPYELALGFTYSKQITDRVSGGVTFKFLNSKIDLVDASGIAFDFGFTYNTGYRGLKLGFAATNIGPQSRYEGDGLVRQQTIADPSGSTAFLRFGSEPFELPAAVNFGASMELYRNEQNAITGMLEQNINSFQASRTNMGLEYGFQNMFFARMGYTSTLKKDRDYKTGKASTAGLTFGGGIDYKFNDNLGFTVDYGYLDMGQLDATHRFTVGIKF
ncbi:PorV/PorQ family protein [bacterium]|nr:PorV/PorQ family protein [bacterium]